MELQRPCLLIGVQYELCVIGVVVWWELIAGHKDQCGVIAEGKRAVVSFGSKLCGGRV